MCVCDPYESSFWIFSCLSDDLSFFFFFFYLFPSFFFIVLTLHSLCRRGTVAGVSLGAAASGESVTERRGVAASRHGLRPPLSPGPAHDRRLRGQENYRWGGKGWAWACGVTKWPRRLSYLFSWNGKMHFWISWWCPKIIIVISDKYPQQPVSYPIYFIIKSKYHDQLVNCPMTVIITLSAIQ